MNPGTLERQTDANIGRICRSRDIIVCEAYNSNNLFSRSDDVAPPRIADDNNVDSSTTRSNWFLCTLFLSPMLNEKKVVRLYFRRASFFSSELCARDGKRFTDALVEILLQLALISCLASYYAEPVICSRDGFDLVIY